MHLDDPELTCRIEVTPGPLLVYARKIPGAGGLPAKDGYSGQRAGGKRRHRSCEQCCYLLSRFLRTFFPKKVFSDFRENFLGFGKVLGQNSGKLSTCQRKFSSLGSPNFLGPNYAPVGGEVEG